MPTRLTQDDYNKTFGLPDGTRDAADPGKHRAALKHAMDIRKFEIELYRKRATYFGTFIAAALAGYAVVQRASEPTKTDVVWCSPVPRP